MIPKPVIKLMPNSQIQLKIKSKRVFMSAFGSVTADAGACGCVKVLGVSSGKTAGRAGAAGLSDTACERNVVVSVSAAGASQMPRAEKDEESVMGQDRKSTRLNSSHS